MSVSIDDEDLIHFWKEGKMVTLPVNKGYGSVGDYIGCPCIDAKYRPGSSSRIGYFTASVEFPNKLADTSWTPTGAAWLPAEFRLHLLLLGVET